MPRQIVTPYKPSEDIEQTPLLPSTPTSPDSLQTASGYFAENNHTFMNAHSAQTNDGFNSSFDFPNQNSSTPVTSAAANAGFTSSNPFVNLDNSTTHNKILSEGGGFTNILEDENFSKVTKRPYHCFARLFFHSFFQQCTMDIDFLWLVFLFFFCLCHENRNIIAKIV